MFNTFLESKLVIIYHQNINKLQISKKNMEKDIGKITKNDNTDIVVRIDDFGGKIGLTIREFTTSERYTGFTKSGTRISQETFKAFKELINSINEKEFLEMVATPKAEKVPAAPKEKKATTKKKKESVESVSDEDLL